MFKSGRILAAYVVSLSVVASSASAQSPIATAAQVLFGLGVISGPANDGAPTFSPDGDTLYFARANNSWGFILESHKVAGKWQQPTMAPFSGQWSDQQPAFSPDGQHLVFVSMRTPAVPPATGMLIGRSAAIWQVDRVGTGWSEPKRLPDTVNLSARVFEPSLAADGSLYFMAQTSDAKTWRLYRSQLSNGAYQKAEPLSFSDGNHTDVDPQIAPDQSFLIFSIAGRATPGDSHEHLYITFRSDSGWADIKPLRYEGDYEKCPCDDGEANLSPDGRTLYFNSQRTTNEGLLSAAADTLRQRSVSARVRRGVLLSADCLRADRRGAPGTPQRRSVLHDASCRDAMERPAKSHRGEHAAGHPGWNSAVNAACNIPLRGPLQTHAICSTTIVNRR